MSASTGSYTPPEETPWTIDELIRKRAAENPDTPLVAYPSVGTEYIEYTASQLDTCAFRVAQIYSKSMSRRRCSAENIKTVGILASSNIDYLLSTLALTKMGMTVLFLSTRLTEQAYLSLLETTGCRDLVVDSIMKKTALSLHSRLSDLCVHDLITAKLYSQPLPFDESNTAMDSEYDPAVESSNICWIIHSSGSTGLPKPIYQTHAAALRNYANNFGMRGFITLPLYHAHGISSVFRGIHSERLIHMYNASLPLTAPTLIDTMKKHSFEVFYGVPYALKLLGESQEGIDVLRKLKLVMFGGSSCPKDLGDRLVKNGVQLISHYGTYV
jgi:acyl-CoA synthetase (AMP-forming)/AMP-acid ligase II